MKFGIDTRFVHNREDRMFTIVEEGPVPGSWLIETTTPREILGERVTYLDETLRSFVKQGNWILVEDE